MSRRRAIFLDRDGVINRNVLDVVTGEYGPPRSAKDFELAPGAISGMITLQKAGFLLFLVSNQPDWAKGKSSRQDLAAVHERLAAELQARGVAFSEFYYCYHHPNGIVEGISGPCDCRKPSPYFLLKAEGEFNLCLEASWMIGDRSTDIECGQAAGVRTIRVQEDHAAEPGRHEAKPDFEAKDLAAAARVILAAGGKC